MLESTRRWLTGTVAAALLVGAAGSLSAQERGEREQRGISRSQQQQQQQQQPTILSERDLAAWLIVANQCEVEISRFVQDRAESQPVAQFAELMQQDHQKFIDELQDAGFSLQQRRGQGRLQAQASESGRYQAGYGQRGIPFQSLLQRLQEQSTSTLTEELEKKQGRELDLAYMRGQVLNHVAMRDTLEVFSENLPQGELQDLVDREIESTIEHLAYARRILRRMEESGGRQAQDQQQQERFR